VRKGTWPTFTARPYVCGALGPFTADRLAALREAGPATQAVYEAPGVVLYGSAPLEPYAPGAFAWGTRRPEGGMERAPSWLKVAEGWETPGLVDGPDEVTLHAGAFGLVDVYYLQAGGAVYFSGLIEPLLALARRPYEVNWDAWAAILKLTYPLLEDTPYREVKRLPGATALTWSRRRGRVAVDRRAPRWVREEPVDRGVTARDMVALLHEALKPYDDRPVLVPVSGGYDSRLLASVAVARRMDVESWTTSPDDGLDNDIDFARYITRELGIPHRIIPQDAAAYPDEALWTARRLEYQTSHHAWYAPFAREVHKAGRPLVDGLAGGPLMKNFLLSAAVDAEDAASRRAALLRSLANGEAHLPVLSERAGAWIDERVGEAFAQATSMLRGHRAELPLSVLHTRTARGIARSPVNLVGPEATPIFPFLHPDFFDAALSVPVTRKDGGRFYREILRAANPRVASLPSTNVWLLPNRRVPLRSGGPAAREWSHRMLRRVASIEGLLSEQMLQVIEDGPDALTAFRSWNSRFWLRGLVVFGAWLADYEDLLGDLTPPWS
jgi:Asparagine synthase (glutamine-hydrolyzing)